MYGEDVMWARQCSEAGFATFLEPAATAIHIGRASVVGSQPSGFAQSRRAQFELAWFSRRSPYAQLASRGILALHAVLRIVALCVLRLARRKTNASIVEFLVLLRAAARGGT
jgi:GT2 family glycosyltransferase